MIELLFTFLIFIIIIFASKFQKKLIFLPKDNPNKVQSVNISSNTILLNVFLLSPFMISYFKLSLILPLVIIFIIGLLDDFINLSVSKRFFLVSITLIFCFSFNNEYLLSEFIFNYKFLVLNFYQSFFISIFLILGFIHVMNMSDGRNGLVVSYLIIIVGYLILKSNFVIDNLYFVLLFGLLLALVLNILNISYFGNNGIFLVSVLFGILLFYFYIHKILYIREIFLLLFIPFYDGLYVTFNRVINKKNPFVPDKSHLHHLPKISNWYLSLIIIITVKILLLTLSFFTNVNFIFLIIISLISYTLLRFYLKRL